MDRRGEHQQDGWVTFACGEQRCGAQAGAVQLVAAGQPFDMGRPLGTARQASSGLVVKAFGTTSWYSIRHPATLSRIQREVDSQRPDPSAFAAVDRHCLPFYCSRCGLNYCKAGWTGFPYLRDDGYYLTDIPRPHDHAHTTPQQA